MIFLARWKPPWVGIELEKAFAWAANSSINTCFISLVVLDPISRSKLVYEPLRFRGLQGSPSKARGFRQVAAIPSRIQYSSLPVFRPHWRLECRSMIQAKKDKGPSGYQSKSKSDNPEINSNMKIKPGYKIKRNVTFKVLIFCCRCSALHR
ncbi:hypothetical protein PGTUg99_018934 [Puccinia graminis f. sp. tritici]|uniref:Uncharacterized protein n=1 Tax=Puccinia graminis f. sp. tritici TaxID=56615 RepID=A0A5B0RVA8_PUCGR|nr:hypothetical protein PGTUg99_018934 [Puccinia graminis f. sp. tritici]